MSFFSTLDQHADITDITFNDRKRLGPLDKASDQIMRGPSEFTPAERELMAAYVSGLNACHFCFGSHAAVAAQFGISEEVINQLITDVEQTTVADKLKPVFHYLHKLTLAPSKIIEKDAQAVYDVGWSEAALHEAILVGCLFNFYNRLLDGHGVKGSKRIYEFGGEHLFKNGYAVPWFIGAIKGFVRKQKLKKLGVQ